MKRTMISLGLAMVIGRAAFGADAGGSSLAKVQLKDWIIDGGIQKVVGQKLYDLIDGFADIHMGFSYIDSQHMKLKNGKKQFEVSLFREDTSDNAFGLFTCLRQRDGEPVDLPDEGSYSGGTAHLWRGPYCAEVKDVGEESASKEELLAVLKSIGDTLGGKHQPPELVRALPKEKLAERGVMYFRNRHPLDQLYYVGTENVLLLDSDVTSHTNVEAVYATYDLPNGAQGILTIRYPEAEKGARALALFSDSLKKELASTSDQPPWRTMTARNGKQTIALQKGRLLIFALESSQADAIRPIMETIAKNLEPKKEAEGKK